MKGEDENRSESLTKKGVRVINKDVAVFAFFLFLSFTIWYLNSLGKESESEIKFQLEYTNIPKDKVITSQQPSDLTLFLKGHGYSILKLKISGQNDPLIIDFSKVNYKRAIDDKEFNYYILTSGLTKSLNVQIGSGCEITSVKPDTLFFTLSKAIENSSGITDNKKKH